MALRDELILDTKKAQASIRALGQQLTQVNQKFSKEFGQTIKAPTIEPIKAPKIDRPVIPAPDTSVAISRLRELASSVKSGFVTAGRQIGTTLAGVTTAVGALGVISVKTFATFEQTLSRLVGLANVPAREIEGISKALLDLAPQVGRTPQELAEGLYFIASSGFSASQALEILEVSAKGAVSGLGDTQTVARIVAATMNAYGHENITAAKTVDVLTAAVTESTFEASELADQLGDVLPFASQLQVPFEQVAAAMSAMSLKGLNAAEAATALRQVLATILDPSKEGRDLLESLGLSAAKMRDILAKDGLNAALITFAEASQSNLEATSKLFGNVRALNGVLSLGGTNAQRTAELFDRMRDSTGKSAEAFEAYRETSKFAFDSLRASIQAASISFGSVFAPIAAGAAGAISKSFEDLTGRVQNFSSSLSAADIEKKMLDIKDAVGELTPAVAGLGVALGAKFGAGIPIIGQYLRLFAFWPTVLGGVVLSTEEGRGAIYSLGKQLRDVAKRHGPDLLDALHSLTNSIGTGLAIAIEKLGPPLVDIADSLAELAIQVLPPLASAMGAVATIAGGVLGAGLTLVANVLGFVSDNAGVLVPLITGLTAAFLTLKVAAGISSVLETLGIKMLYAGDAINALRSASATAGGGVKGFATAMGGLQAATGGAGSAIGAFNPYVLGITAVVGVATIAFMKWQKEKDRLAKQSRNITLGLADEAKSVREVAGETAKAALEEKHRDDDLAKLGFSQARYTDAVLGNADAQKELRAALVASGDVTLQVSKGSYATTKLTKEQTAAWIENGDAIERSAAGGQAWAVDGKGVLDTMNEINKQIQDNSRQQLEALVISDKLDKSRRDELETLTAVETGQVNYAKALELAKIEMGESLERTDLLTKKSNEFKSAMDRLTSGFIDSRQSLIEYKDGSEELGRQLLASAGNLDINTVAGRDNQTAILSLIQTSQNHAAALLAEGKTYGEASAFLNDFASQLRGQLYNSYIAAGLGADEANRKADAAIKTFNLTPEQIHIQMVLAGANEAKLKAAEFINETKKVPKDKKTELIANIEEGRTKKVKDYIKTLELTKGERKIIIDAVTGAAETKLAKSKRKKDELVEKKSIKIDANTDSADKDIKSTQKKKDTLVEPKTIKVDADTSAARDKINSLAGRRYVLTVEGRALGGPVAAQTAYVVGEKGPELFVPDRDGQIVPNNKLQSMAASVPSQQSSGIVSISEGAVQVHFNGPVQQGMEGQIKTIVDGAFREFYNELRSA